MSIIKKIWRKLLAWVMVRIKDRQEIKQIERKAYTDELKAQAVESGKARAQRKIDNRLKWG